MSFIFHCLMIDRFSIISNPAQELNLNFKGEHALSDVPSSLGERHEGCIYVG